MMQGFFDIHTHIIPNVDDGSKSLDMTKQILEMEYADGVRTIFATSHYRVGMFEPKLEDIFEGYKQVKEMAKTIGDERITVLLGCEFHANMDMIETLDKKLRPTMDGTRCVLVEFKNGSEKSFIKERCYALLSHGYQPIIAHIERYEVCRKDISLIEDLYDMGCYIQVNSQSILGDDGFFLKQYCKKLIRNDLIHFVASDAHNVKERRPTIGRVAEYLEKLEGEEYVDHILTYNPQHLILGSKK